MTIALVVIGLLGCAAIAAIGIRFLFQPDVATEGFGVSPGDVRALTAIKGDRDITFGILLTVVLIAAGASPFGWALAASAVAPIGDMLIVLTRGGSRVTAFTVHGLTAAVLIAVGIILGLTA